MRMNRGELIQIQFMWFIELYVSIGGHNGVQKSIMKLRGLDVGYPRLPVMPLDDDQVAALKKDLQDIGFFDWSK